MNKLWPKIIRLEGLIAKFSVLGFLGILIVLDWQGYLDPVEKTLTSEWLTFTLGEASISAWDAARAVVVVIFLFWIASIVSAIGENQLKGMKRLRSSNRALLIKAFQFIVYLFLFLVLLDVLGVDFTALAVIGGGLGIGIGFGLQKIAANFISGLILLFERSIEEGDLIELGDGVLGFVQNTGARYTLVETFDSREVMVPNEDFITSRVVNWTFSNEKGRIEISIGVSYGSDIELARELILEAARDHSRCSKDPEPECYLREFSDSSVDFLLFFWVDDVTQGRFKPQSDVMRAVWRSFKENGIGIPFPQRDVHLIPAAGETTIDNPTADKS